MPSIFANRITKEGVLRKQFEVEPLKGSGWKMTLAHIPKPAYAKMRERNQRTVWDSKEKGHVQRLDFDGLYGDYANFIVLDWVGLKLKDLRRLFAFDTAGMNLDDDVKYDRETLIDILKQSDELALWITTISLNAELFSDTDIDAAAEKKI